MRGVKRLAIPVRRRRILLAMYLSDEMVERRLGIAKYPRIPALTALLLTAKTSSSENGNTISQIGQPTGP
jgi:hypothetical protein